MATLPLNWAICEPIPDQFNFEQLQQQLAWCQKNQLRIAAGPLIDLRETHLPTWLFSAPNSQPPTRPSLPQLQTAITHYINHFLTSFNGLVDCWILPLTTPEKSIWNWQELSQLNLHIVETIRKTDQTTPLVLQLDSVYPLASQASEAIQQTIDLLLRLELGLCGLSFNLPKYGQLPQESNDYSIRMLDWYETFQTWDRFELPYLVHLSLSDSVHHQPNSTPAPQISIQPTENSEPLAEQQTLAAHIRLLVSLPNLQGISFSLPEAFLQQIATLRTEHQQSNEPQNGSAHWLAELPPIFTTLAELRQQYLI